MSNVKGLLPKALNCAFVLIQLESYSTNLLKLLIAKFFKRVTCGHNPIWATARQGLTPVVHLLFMGDISVKRRYYVCYQDHH